jgi:hypothetical protein
MGNFLYNVDKSRKEWLKKPNPIPTRARYLNANLNASLVEEVVVVVVDAQLESESKLESNSNQDPKLETE